MTSFCQELLVKRVLVSELSLYNVSRARGALQVFFEMNQGQINQIKACCQSIIALNCSLYNTHIPKWVKIIRSNSRVTLWGQRIIALECILQDTDSKVGQNN